MKAILSTLLAACGLGLGPGGHAQAAPPPAADLVCAAALHPVLVRQGRQGLEPRNGRPDLPLHAKGVIDGAVVPAVKIQGPV
jgi:hypothetical protein